MATSCEELTHWKRLWCWEGLGAGGEGDDRGWDGWMASLTRWTWVWVNSGSWWWTGRPGVLRFMGSQRVGHDWVTELNWTECLPDWMPHTIYRWGVVMNFPTIAVWILFWVSWPFFEHVINTVTSLTLKEFTNKLCHPGSSLVLCLSCTSNIMSLCQC